MTDFSDKNGGYGGKCKMGIKWKMWIILVVFIVCVLVSIWLVQVRMLNYFYQTARFNELDDFAENISASLGNSELTRMLIYERAEELSLNIWLLGAVPHQENTMRISVSSVDEEYPFQAANMASLYERTVENGGRYIATVPYRNFGMYPNIDVLEDNFGHKDSFPDVVRYDRSIGTLHSVVITVEGRTDMLVQYANLTPIQSIVSMLKRQFISIGVTMVLLALLLAAILSKVITKPFVKMNSAAKKLAMGNYDADFSGEGYREINELAMTLNYASRELAKTDNLQKELISNISHDLRTPLTMIKGYSEVIRDIPGENTPENIQVIIDETPRLSELVNDMLDLSKIQSGTRRPDSEIFSITELVRDTLTRYERLIMQDGYDIEFFAEDDAMVVADSGMILQVIYNLINNAINYTGEDKRVLVKQSVSDTSVRISVSDTGEGIAEKDIAQIWDRYYRVDKVHKRATIGTGLGLSIVKEILEAHDASYGIDSVVGGGSTFWFELNKATLPEFIDAEYETTVTEKNEDFKG